MFLEFWLQASRDETVWKAVIAPYRHYQEHFARLVEDGIAEGSLKPTDSQVSCTDHCFPGGGTGTARRARSARRRLGKDSP